MNCLILVVLAALMSGVERKVNVPISENRPALTLGEPDRGGLIGLAGGGILLWSNRGQIQIRHSTGDWSPVIPLGMTSLDQVIPDGTGVMGRGSSALPEGDRQSAILRLGATGTIIERWEPAGSLVLSIASTGDKRWATVLTTRSSPLVGSALNPAGPSNAAICVLVELKSGGRIETRGQVETNAEIVSFAGGRDETLRIDCVPADLSKAKYHEPYCAAVGPGGWRMFGLWNVAPSACGPYLIEFLDSPAGTGLAYRQKRPQLAVRRVDTGEVVATRSAAAGQAIACGAAGELLVGRDEVRALSLPDLKVLWRVPSPGGRVVAMARGSDQSLWVATSSNKVLAVPEPRRPRRPF